MVTVRSVDIETLLLFESTLWKDQREIALTEQSGVRAIHKREMFSGEFTTEVEVLRALKDAGCTVPEVLAFGDGNLFLKYTPGIRLFNLLVHLDELADLVGPATSAAKTILLKSALAQERRLQRALAQMSASNEVGWHPYPILEKCGTLLKILCEALGVSYSTDRLDSELRCLEEEWNSLASVPFRDAAPKNIMIQSEELWLGNFSGDEKARQEFIRQSFIEAMPDLPDWCHASTMDFDFGSCIDLTLPEDDPLSLLCHERTFEWSRVNAAELCWIPSLHPDRRRCAIAFLVRFLRFGGRKAAYRLLHPQGFVTRFRYDDDRFYFDHLNPILEVLDVDLQLDYPLLSQIWQIIRTGLASVQVVHDQIMMAGVAAKKQQYYVDVFPY